MSQKSLLLLYCLIFSFTMVYAGDIVLVNSDRHGLEIKWELKSYTITPCGDYSIIQFPGGCGLYAVGKPNIPSQQAFIEVPMDGKLVLDISQPLIEIARLAKPIVPAQEPPIDTIGAENLKREFIQDKDSYASPELFPGRVVEIAYQGIMRGRKLALVKFNPIQYIPKTGEVLIYKKFNLKIEFYGATRDLGETDAAMDPIAQGLVINYQPAKKQNRAEAQYLIITVPELEEQAKTFAEWKKQKGLTTAIEVLPHNPTVTTVKEVIQKYYPGVVYVLILGDHTLIALKQSADRHPLGRERCRQLGLADGSVPSDLFYSCLEGDDYYPDVVVGRIPAGNVEEANLLINKIMGYQKNPPQGKWLKRFVLCGEFQYQYSKKNTAERLFCETAFTIWNSLKDKYEFPTQTIGTGSYGLGHAEYYFRTPADPNNMDKPGSYRSKINDKNPPVVECRMPDEWVKNIVSDTDAKKNTLAFWKEGAFLVQHRDHGGETGWGKPSLGKNDVSNLDNGDKLPVLFSINCLTGAMDYSSDCFVEAALKNANGGAVSAIGSTRVSYSWWNDRLCDGFYTCLFGTGIYDCLDTEIAMPTEFSFSKKLGMVLNFGKMYLARNYPSNPWGTSYDYTETEFYLFHCIGDPDLDIWTGELTALNVAVNRGDGLQLTVSDQQKRTPIANAQVCLYGQGRQIVVRTDARGNCLVNQKLKGSYTLTVTGDNLYPYQTTVKID